MTYITRLLAVITLLLACMQFSACFDIPSEPSTKTSIKSVTIQVEQNGNIDTTLLKINPMDTAVLSAKIHPSKLKKDVNFAWFYTADEGVKNKLGKDSSFTIPPKTSSNKIPNLLEITDQEGNSSVYEFKIITNTPPVLNAGITPSQGDTLYGNATTSFLFSWQSYDKDDETLNHTITIDSSLYELGDITRFYQSGFSEGKHTFQIFVFDEYGDKDSSSVISFYVINKERNQQ